MILVAAGLYNVEGMVGIYFKLMTTGIDAVGFFHIDESEWIEMVQQSSAFGAQKTGVDENHNAGKKG
jgi:hypothetical protein